MGKIEDEVFAARSNVLRRTPGFLQDFFSNPDNVDHNRDENGNYVFEGRDGNEKNFFFALF